MFTLVSSLMPLLQSLITQPYTDQRSATKIKNQLNVLNFTTFKQPKRLKTCLSSKTSVHGSY